MGKRAAGRSISPLSTYLNRKKREQEEVDKKIFPGLGKVIPCPAKPAAKKRPRPAEREGAEEQEQELARLRLRQAQLQQNAAAVLAVKFSIPLPAAESAARIVDQAIQEAASSTT